MKKIPLKNYLVLIFISIITILLIIYLVNIYNSKKEYENSTNDRMNFIKEITTEDFDNYLRENPDFIIYSSNSESEDIISLEKKLRNKLIKKDYIKQMVYLNLKNTPIDFIETLKEHTVDPLKTNGYNGIPNVLVVEDGYITKILYIDNNSSVEDIIKFIENNYD